MPISQPSATVVCSSSSYVGNDGVNRAIPHSLGRKPNLVVIRKSDVTALFTILSDTTVQCITAGAIAGGTVTAKDTTNFYVGQNGDMANTANANGITYYWTAL